MKIVFWGTPKFSVPIFESIYNSDHEIIAVVTQPDKRRNRGKSKSGSPIKKKALELNIRCFSPHNLKEDTSCQREIADLNADAYVVVAYGQILPKLLLKSPNKGCWNIHASLLPKWRGAAPINRSIMNGDDITGICIMKMEQGLDTGAVLLEQQVKIEQLDNAHTLSNKLNIISSEKILEALSIIEGKEFSKRENELLIAQNKLKGRAISYAKMISREEYLINWDLKENIICNNILGLYPNAYTYYKGKRLKVLEAIPINISFDKILSAYSLDYKNYEDLKAESSGQIICALKNIGIVVATKYCPILILGGKLEGKSYVYGNSLIQQLYKEDEVIKLGDSKFIL